MLLSGDINLNPGPFNINEISSQEVFPFSNDQNHSVNTYNLIERERPVNDTTWDKFKSRGLHFLHLNANSLLPKIDEIRHIAKISNASLIGISESKLDSSILDNEIAIENFNLIRLDRTRRGGGVVCYIRKSLSYNLKEKFCPNTESIFVDIFLPKSKPILVGILYRPPDKPEFLDYFNECLIQSNITNIQECYFMGDFNINLLYEDKMILEKQCSVTYNQIQPMTKKYLDLCFLNSLSQLILQPTRTTSQSQTLIDHILTNSSEKIVQSGTIEIGLSDHELIYCTRKGSMSKQNRHNKFL